MESKNYSKITSAMKFKLLSLYISFLLLLLVLSVASSQTLIPVGNGIQDDEGMFKSTSHVEKYDSLYFIAGVFDSINSYGIRTIAIWDGHDFADGTAGLDPISLYYKRVDKLYVFDEILYMSFENDSKLYNWSGEEWELFMEGIGGGVIIEDKLYFHGNGLQVDTLPPSDIIYYQDGQWTNLNVIYDFPGGGDNIGIIGLTKWQNKLVVSPTPAFAHGISILDSSGNLSEIDSNYLEGTLYSVQDKLFLLKDSYSDLYEYRDEKFEFLLEIDDDFHGFFELEDELYLGSIQDGTYVYKDGNFILRGTDYLSIFDFEKLVENKYIITGKLHSGTDYIVRLNDLAIMTYEKPIVSLKMNKDTICENEYVYFTAQENDVFMEYFWEFEGALTPKSNNREPKIKYPKEGEYNVTLVTKNIVGYSDTITSKLIVESGCNVERDRNYDNTWLLGYHFSFARTVAGLDFSNSDPQSVMFNSPSSFSGQSLSMSDKDGNLLFYSNGNSIYDYNNIEVKNSKDFNTGENIMGYGYDTHARPQQMISIPSDVDDNIYYIFHLPQELGTSNFTVVPTKLLMSQIHVDNERNLEMIIQNVPLIQDTLHNYTMQAHRHANGEDWWILAFQMFTNNYYKILLKPNGETIVEKEEFDLILERAIYQTVFSPNGNKFALSGGEDKMTYLWDFNTHTGNLSNRIDISGQLKDDFDTPRGVAFSPNSRFLYLASYHFMKQYDLCSDTISESEAVVGIWDGLYDWIYPFSFGRLRLGPDNKIYSSSYRSSVFLSTIHNPDLIGLDSDFRQHDFELAEENKNASNSIPEFPHYRNTSDSLNCDVLNSIAVDHINPNNIQVYPNPTYNNLDIISTENLIESDLIIYNDRGEMVLKNTYNGNSINVEDLNAGIYYLSIKTNEKTSLIPFIKI